MFSSIKSYLLGTSTTVVEETKVEKSDAATSSVHESSSLLELTFNAATSKITEQLLPPSASIEQLQSSSHQLLPTLNEQQEEELKKLNKLSGPSPSTVETNDDEDECFNDDSWELLDLVEKPTASNNLKDQVESSNSTVQDVVFVNVPTLLATHGESVPGKEPTVVVRNHKQLKVSFETPDLVKERELKIDQVDSAIIETKPATKKNKKNKNKNNKHKPDTPSLKNASLPNKVKDKSSKAEAKIISPAVSKKPILNYAQVLKPKSDASFSSQEIFLDQKCEVSEAITLKRNRTVSTTSWSSADESDLVATYWFDDIKVDTSIAHGSHQVEEIHANCEAKLKPEVDEVDPNAINGSMISSTFSDFDCRYQEINDFVLKPKKRRNKKQKRLPQTSLVSTFKRPIPVDGSKKTNNDLAEPTNELVKNNKSSTNCLKLKTKKKNASFGTDLVSSSVDFIKSSNLSEKVQSSGTKSDRKNKKNNPDTVLRTTVSSSPVYSSLLNTDSSDGQDMDESWFVTPPPCFTNVSKTKSSGSKLKQAHRENELIEHPSVYFSNSLKDSETQIDTDAKEKINHAKISDCSVQVSLIGANGVQKISNTSKSLYGKLESKQVSTSKSACKSNKKKGEVCSGNKFIVTSWAFDEQDDIDDFDNMFGNDWSSEEARKTLPKKKTKKNQNKFESMPIIADYPISMNDSYDSELLHQSSPVSLDIDISVLSSLEESINANDKINSVVEDLALNDNMENKSSKISNERRKITNEKKAPVPVQPIEPERKPGWQLKRKRNKRRFLNTSLPINQGTVKTIKDHYPYSDSSYNSSSARSTPSIIDRIGSSIVANLTNLASDFTASPMQSRPPMQELNNRVVGKPSAELELINRKKLSKCYMDRQNGCAKFANSNKREGRGLKMHKTFNGYSLDRKVQTNFTKSQ